MTSRTKELTNGLQQDYLKSGKCQFARTRKYKYKQKDRNLKKLQSSEKFIHNKIFHCHKFLPPKKTTRPRVVIVVAFFCQGHFHGSWVFLL